MSEHIEEADWLRERLSPPNQHIVTSIVPGGFEAYARILHPAQLPEHDDRLVRWSEVSQWSGVPMHDRVQWHEIALPQGAPAAGPPWRGQGPRQGSPFESDVRVLLESLSASTITSEECFFCLWMGYLGSASVMYTSSGPSVRLPPPPQPARVVALPLREYALFEGPLSSASAFESASHWHHQSANLWWPADRAWCVASEIDLQWTYVGGSAELVNRILTDDRIEALPAAPADPSGLILVGWLSDLIEAGASEVLASGSTSLSLSLGTVEVTWRKSRPFRHGLISSTTAGFNGTSSGQSPLRTRDIGHLRRQIRGEVQRAVLGLVEA
ncbi:MAG: hypothetical protein ACREGR_00810 [Minisyncoccia bacterium]